MKKILLLTMVVILLASSLAIAGITGSKHDLSGAGYGTTQICIFCHTPHNAVTTTIPAPLWNHVPTTVNNYTLYQNGGTLNATIGQPGATSKACLSCHDGTIAIDSYYGHGAGVYGGGPTAITGTHTMTGTAMLGTDLSNDHPIGFTYDAALATADTELATPSGGTVGVSATKLPLYGSPAEKMECPTCHKVHDNTNAPFLRMANTASALCLNCHIK